MKLQQETFRGSPFSPPHHAPVSSEENPDSDLLQGLVESLADMGSCYAEQKRQKGRESLSQEANAIVSISLATFFIDPLSDMDIFVCTCMCMMYMSEVGRSSGGVWRIEVGRSFRSRGIRMEGGTAVIISV